MTKLIDISVSLQAGMPTWPGTIQFSHIWSKRIENGDGVNSSVVTMDLHAGTHIDAPLHFIEDGHSVDLLDLGLLCGEARVIDCGGAEAVTAAFLDSVSLPAAVDRLLVKSVNSLLWQQDVFDPAYVGLTEDAALWVVNRGIKLIGVDYLSVQRFNDSSSVHTILLNSGVVILEGLDLSQVSQGNYELICFPLKIRGAEGAPARAVLRKNPDN